MLSYSELEQQLKSAQIGISAAELHGFLTGLISGGLQDQSWQPLLYQFTNDNHAYPTTLLNEVTEIYQEIHRTLSDVDGFNFELLLPETSVFATADALCEWANHFLLGVGLAQPQLDKQTGEVGEALDDLQDIGQLGYDTEDNQEELAEALEEIIEYVRTIAALFYSHFVQPEPKQPTLH
ncbi:MAG: YecA family protein [Lonepinella koalarum]|nr:YecA family protein [Lonepinella koalarum]